MNGRRWLIAVLGVVVVGLLVAAGVAALTNSSTSSSGQAGALALRQVVSGSELNGESCPPPTSTPESATLCTKDGRASVELGPIVVDGADVLTAEAIQSEPGSDEWRVAIALNEEATDEFASFTGVVANSPPPANFVAIVVDDVIVSVPQVNEAVTSGQIEVGGLTQAEAEDLAAQFD